MSTKAAPVRVRKERRPSIITIQIHAPSDAAARRVWADARKLIAAHPGCGSSIRRSGTATVEGL